MSAGQSYRRGYIYGVTTPIQRPRTGRQRGEYNGAATLIVTAAMSALIVAVLSNPFVASALGRLLGSLLFH